MSRTMFRNPVSDGVSDSVSDNVSDRVAESCFGRCFGIVFRYVVGIDEIATLVRIDEVATLFFCFLKTFVLADLQNRCIPSIPQIR